MKKIISIFLMLVLMISCSYREAYALEDDSLYAISAVIIDAKTKRVLYGKNEMEARANASTTKIMTAILALENGDMEAVVTASAYATKMPDVQLDMKEGQQFYLKDLMYSMMLESHNDSAVAIAEHISGDVDNFLVLMNKKAMEIGMKDTYFMTPNGLDKREGSYWHHSTAYDLALLMEYCVKTSPKSEEFIEICQEKSHTFTDYTGRMAYVVNNKNSLFDMLDGVVAGKTGFTGEAGYCYVGAFDIGGNLYTFALLGCGWPSNKNYKWKDSKKLYKYAKENYETVNVMEGENASYKIAVDDGIESAYVTVSAMVDYFALVSKEDNVRVEKNIPEKIKAPVYEGDIIGSYNIYINDYKIETINFKAEETIHKINFEYYLNKIINIFMF